MSNPVSIRFARESDTKLILEFISELAQYEKLAHEVVATEESLRQSLFGERPQAEAILAFCGDQAAGFALFFHNYSTFLGQRGLYLEDLYVRPQWRGQSVGRRLLAHLAELARQRQCGRLEWWVLDWNKKAIDFYHKLGAVPMDEWTVFRLTGEALSNLAKEDTDE